LLFFNSSIFFLDESITNPFQSLFINKNLQLLSEKSSTPNSIKVLLFIDTSRTKKSIIPSSPHCEKILNFVDKFNDKGEIDGYDVKLIPNNIQTA
jgi:hypothetical protein